MPAIVRAPLFGRSISINTNDLPLSFCLNLPFDLTRPSHRDLGFFLRPERIGAAQGPGWLLERQLILDRSPPQ